MKPSLNYPQISYCLLFCLQAVSSGTEIPRLDAVASALNTGPGWSGGVAPGAGDVMLWNNLYGNFETALTDMPQLGGNMSVQGVKVTDVGGARTGANKYIGFINSSSANTLTIGNLGIDMSTATHTLLMHSRFALSANQSWNIGDANTDGTSTGLNNSEDLAMVAQAANIPFDFGGFTATTSGNGHITLSSGYTLSNGTLNVGNNLTVIQGGSSRVTTLQNTLNLIVTSGRLRLQANSGAGGVSLTSSAPATVNAGTLELRSNTNALSVTQGGALTLNAGSGLTFLVDSTGANSATGNVTVNGASTWRVSGGGNPTNGALLGGSITGSGNITYSNVGTGASTFLRLNGNNSGYTGTFSIIGGIGNRSLRLSNANSGSSAASWFLGVGNNLQVDGVAVQLGSLNGFGHVTNISTATPAAITVGSGVLRGDVTNGAFPLAVTKVGPGTLRLTGTNTYSGATTVSGGTLIASTDQTGLTNVTIADGATYGTLVKDDEDTMTVGDVTVGSSTGGSLLVDFGDQPNAAFANFAVSNLMFNGTSRIKIAGKNLTPGGPFPIIQYGALAGGSAPIASLGLDLPLRTTGSLSSSASEILLTINATEQIKWNGDLSNDWDIDPDGSGSTGTPNWKTTVGGASARYIQSSLGSDVVRFDDSATGTGTVNLPGTVLPQAVVFSNSTAKSYTLTGSGKISGLTDVVKDGDGVVTFANTTPYDYTGDTVINAGSLRLGDGTTPGAGIVDGRITNNATLVLNRPEDHDFNYVITGTGITEKALPNIITVPNPTTIEIPLLLSAGKLKFNNGGTLTGPISGSGLIESLAGNLELGGNLTNTHTGNVTVSSGVLRLTKTAGNAIGGDVYITGNATMAILANDQIADTSTVHILTSSADSLINSTGVDTFANAVVNGVPTTQMILRNTPTITGTATVNNGILGVASAHSATINAVVLTSPTALLRVAGAAGISTLNVGAGGITASAGEVQVKFNNTGTFDTTLNLAGDVTTTGNLAFTNGGFTGTQLNNINLSGNRVFNIGAGTTTTVAPDLANASLTETLTKSGDGTLTLNTTCAASIPGGTTVGAGTLIVNGTLAGSLQVNAAGTIGGSGSLSGAVTAAGTVAPGAVAAPGIGQLNATGSLTFGPDSDFAVGVGNWAGTTPGTHWDFLNVATLAFTATPANPLTIHVSGTPTGFTESAKTIVVATSVAAVSGFDLGAIVIDSSGFTGTGTWAAQLTGNNVELVYTAGFVSPYNAWATAGGLTGANDDPSDDPDNDGDINLVEFALSGSPLSGTANTKVVSKLATVGGQQALTLTLPVRNDVVFSGSNGLNGAADGIVYFIEATDDLGTWNLGVSEVIGADATAIQNGISPALPVLPAGWTYRTFRSPGPVTGDPREYIRLRVSPAA